MFIPGMIVISRGLRETLQWMVVDLPGQRAGARMDLIERYVTFAREHALIDDDRITELVEMLLNGARFADAIGELRASRPLPARKRPSRRRGQGPKTPPMPAARRPRR